MPVDAAKGSRLFKGTDESSMHAGGRDMSATRVGVRTAVWVGVVVAVLWGGHMWADVTNPDGVAVIIGNRNYEHAENVEFAHRDSEAFKRYVVELLGFDPDRILDLRDAGLTQMIGALGSQRSYRGRVWRLLKPNRRSDVVVFYSGHGVPGLNDKRGYLMPVDAEPELAELTGYSVDLLHGNLGKLEARSVAVYVDACFTGDSEAGMLFKDASPVRSQVRLPAAGDEGVTLLTAASGKQLASWDRETRHGLFTNHLLDGLYGGADLDQDGRVTAGETKEYLDNHMTPAAQARGREQTATLTGGKQKVLSVARFPARSRREEKAKEVELEKARKENEALGRERARLVEALEAGEEALEKVGGERAASVQRHAELAREIEVQRRELAEAKSEQERLTGVVAEQEAELQRLRERGERESSMPRLVEAALALAHADFVAIQRGLVSTGKRLGRVDGVFGPQTRQAILEWQGKKGVEATGYLTRDQAEALKALGEEVARAEKEKKAERERLRPGREFEDCPECPRMVVVPAGEYMMGSRSKEGTNDERPRHRVRIGKAFAVGKYEVTFAEWDACVAAGGCRRYRPGDRGWGRGKRPVINVSWEDAKAYAGWLSEKTGKEYRLLSESEWEYVARAGATTAYWWGDEIGTGKANCDGCGSRWDDDRTAPVGWFEANAFGLYDVHGNVWEWVEDCWRGSYSGAPADGSVWVSGGDCSKRVLRGGSWYFNPWHLRSANRNWYSAGFRNDGVGFRIARTLTP